MPFSKDPSHWRARAEEARQNAERITGDPAAKKLMLEIADDYDRIADRIVGAAAPPPGSAGEKREPNEPRR